MSLVRSALLLAALLIIPATAPAAFILIDDTDPLFITITAGDFEGGFSVDGTLLTFGLGASGTITLPDVPHSISGTWIDLGGSLGSVDLFFAISAGSPDVTSAGLFTASSDGFLGTVTGLLLPYTGSVYGMALPTLAQGSAAVGAYPFLTIVMASESTPEPSTLVLLGSALIAVAIARRKTASR